MLASTWPLLSLFRTFLMFAGIFLSLFFTNWPFFGALISPVARPLESRLAT
jgi:hypothetical protein